MAAALAVSAGAAAGQNSWVFEVEYSDPAGVINSVDDTATVRLWAAWDPEYYAFHRAKLDVTADDLIDSGVWLKSRRVLNGPGSSDGTIDGERVAGVIPSQLVLAPNFLGDTSNPILAWEGTWSTTVFHIREVPVMTESLEFRLYADIYGNSKSVIGNLNEGAGFIRVVPSVTTVSPLALGFAACARRQRR